MEERVEMFVKDGKDFIFIDLKNIHNNDEYRIVLEKSMEILEKREKDASLYAIVDVQGMFYDMESKNILIEWARFNKSYINTSVVIGLNSIKKIMLNSIVNLAGRKNILIMKNKQEAIEWLTRQE